MKKKVGVLTFHGADNLGAVLQAYALCKYITDNLDAETEIVDYSCDEVEKTRYANDCNGIKKIPLIFYYKIKRKGFDKFRNKFLPLSNKKYVRNDIESCNLLYSTFITGSDQVWNIECSGDDTTYFLDFVEPGKNKIAYAASIGSIDFKEEKVKEINKLLKDFKAISVRESSSIQKLKLADQTPILPDPVFLLDKCQWKDIITKRIKKKKYVLVYLIQEDVNVVRVAREYANKHDYDIIINKKSIDFILNNSPECFLSWIDNAEAVFTNSFHGTAFSIIFNKMLGADIVLKNGGVNNRIRELLCSAGLDKCIISDKKSEPTKAEADKWLDRQRKSTYDFLKKNI
ncbi:polysaccharide pyruvyl transferase family protein [Eubacterium sp.]